MDVAGSPLWDLLIPLRVLAHARGTEFGSRDDAFADAGLASTAWLLELVGGS